MAILRSMADLDHTRTRVHFLLGEDDCTSAPAVAVPYVGALLQASGGPAGAEVLTGAGHSVPASTAGRAAIFSLLTAADGCVCRH